MINTLKRLNQDRLNVSSKIRVNPLCWRGQFTPQLVDYLLESYSEPRELVVDPFSGSGTVLYEAASHGLPCLGNELNPAAYLMSKFFRLVNHDNSAREGFLNELKQVLNELVCSYDDMPLFKFADTHRKKYSNLISFAKELLPAISNDSMAHCLAANVLFKAETSRISELSRAVWRSYDYIATFAAMLPYSTSPIDAHLGDARSLHQVIQKEAGLVITSPPYINVFNYHQNHRAIVELLNWDLLRIARSEIGSNRRNRGNRFLTVIQYCLDMADFLDAMSKILRQDGILVMIVGRESKVKGVPFYNGRIIRDLLRLHPSFTRLGHYERHYMNRFGLRIREDILVTKRDDGPCQVLSDGAAREVADKHLRYARNSTSTTVLPDLELAINEVSALSGSDWYTNSEKSNEVPTATRR